ncbi:glycoside hydrolase family 3 N-terminal domain-containing protein [Pedococcus sp. 5OH_020]|uniref:glycoside hydrolase family 3 N-terminal domain-containing protein n=1 Tax=Pedococcus sp. 5OH_020 TaxID=2989814 RepID=UPI0022E9D162|nr:glycoside hydrolase family 3 N-terminal domain-containing protein [Pedococcus sp. 5OH_020]
MTAASVRRLRAVAVGLTAMGLLLSAGCEGSVSGSRASSAPTAAATTSGGTTSGSPSSAGSGAARSATSGSTSAHPSTSATPGVAATTSTVSSTTLATCGQRLAREMSAPQRAGQLIMVGLQATGSSRALAAQVRSQRLGGVIFLGGWSGGAASTATVARRLQSATEGSLLVAVDQEGGQVQQLRGPGFDAIPSARTQATLGAAGEERAVRTWSRQLTRAGVNVNLAPVADTVPTSLGAGNQPIGRYRRDFSPGSPQTNARYVAAFVRGTLAGGVAPTVKHFPGLGRVTGNTDVTSTGITDRRTASGDPYLAPFRAGIEAGAPLVMVSSARYPLLDRDNQAMFSSKVVTDLLRGELGFTGVAITDDVGAARAVSDVPVGARATRFVAAGGDIVLTARPDQAPVMLRAIAAKRAASPVFADQVDRAAARVLDLKASLGLVRC